MASDSSGLSPDFALKLERRLHAAEAARARAAAVERWRWRALVIVPVAAAICWAAIPWTFGPGIRAIIGFISYLSVVVAIGDRGDHVFLSYLNLSALPIAVNGLLLVGVVSWLSWAARPPSANPLAGPRS